MKITTFEKWGKLRIPISKPKNPADATATYMIATGVIPDDMVIVGNLYDAQDNLVARKRVYAYDGPRKNSPFSLHNGESSYLSGEKPEDRWNKATIKLWLNDRQTKDEDGKVQKDDPYTYTSKGTKAELLARVNQS